MFSVEYSSEGRERERGRERETEKKNEQVYIPEYNTSPLWTYYQSQGS